MSDKPHYLGAHCIDIGGIPMAARRAGKSGMTALQIFSAVPKFYNDKVKVRPERIVRFSEELAKAGIQPSNVIVHAGYVLNCATPDESKWTRASGGLAKELERSTSLGVGGVCFHPGAATDGDRSGGIARVAEAMRLALEAVPNGSTRLLIENTAGAGTTLGRTPDEIAEMLSLLPQGMRARAGYGLDTCHLYASGFDISHSQESLTGILDAFENATGEVPSFLHLNDSEGDLGSNRDRHARIGQGRIGREAFSWLLKDARSLGIPCVMETPQAQSDVAEDDDTPDDWELEDMDLLRELFRA